MFALTEHRRIFVGFFFESFMYYRSCDNIWCVHHSLLAALVLLEWNCLHRTISLSNSYPKVGRKYYGFKLLTLVRWPRSFHVKALFSVHLIRQGNLSACAAYLCSISPQNSIEKLITFIYTSVGKICN